MLVLVGCAYDELAEHLQEQQLQQIEQNSAIQVDVEIIETFGDLIWVDFFNHSDYRLVDFDFTFEYFENGAWRSPRIAEFPLPS